jgi:hypothetical protein
MQSKSFLKKSLYSFIQQRSATTKNLDKTRPIKTPNYSQVNLRISKVEFKTFLKLTLKLFLFFL